MWDDTTPRAREIAAWLDAPMDLDEFYGRPSHPLCALVLALWLLCVEPLGPVRVRGRL